jgi:ribosomal protein S8
MEFAMRKKMIEDLRNNYEHEGVVLTIKTSKEKRVVLKCDRGGEYVNVLNLTDETRQSNTHTRLTGCDFEIVCSSVKEIWAIRKISGNHNHELGGNLVGHAVKRRLSKSEKVKV